MAGVLIILSGDLIPSIGPVMRSVRCTHFLYTIFCSCNTSR